MSNSPLVMGILNVTPDSFSGDGLLRKDNYVDEAVFQARRMIEEGADILDVGGETSRPGSTSIPLEEEIRRVVPVVAAIRQEFVSVRISVDTVKAEVARRALQEGANIINDISALSHDRDMAGVVAREKASIVLMHNRATNDAVLQDKKIGNSYGACEYEDVVADVASDLEERVETALKAGIAKDKIILDPGIGFGKTPQQNVRLIAQLEKLKDIGLPVLMGVSRKSFIGHLLDVAIEDRLEGTAASVTACVLKGADILRVHDVKFMSRLIKMAAILRDASWTGL